MKSISKAIFISILFATSLAQAQDYSQVRENSNVWVNECKSCHPSYQKLAEKTGIQTEQYLFNFVSRFILIAAYLHKLETDMRKAGDHLMKNIRL